MAAPQSYFLIDTENFEPLRDQMLTVRPVVRVSIEFIPLGILLMAFDDYNNGFLVVCHEREIFYHFVMSNAVQPPKGQSTVQQGHSVGQAACFLITFLNQLGQYDAIGTFEVASYGEARCSELVASMKNEFFEYLNDTFLKKVHRLRVYRFIMEYNGTHQASQEVLKFLTCINLIGNAELVLKPCREISTQTELSLEGVYSLKRCARPRRLTIREPFWIRVNCERLAKFREITTRCAKLEKEDAMELIQKFQESDVFKSCTITLNELNPDIQSHFMRMFQRRHGGPGVTWTVRGPVRFQINAEDNKLTFTKLLEADEVFEEFPLIDREPFLALKKRMSLIQEIVDLEVDISDKEIAIEVRNKARQDFKVRCKAGGNEFQAGYQFGEDSDQGFRFEHFRGNFIIEASYILASFLFRLKNNTVIGCFKVSELSDVTHEFQMRIIKSTFLSQLEQHFQKNTWFLLVNKFVMKYSGRWEARNEVHAFLSYIKMVGQKELVFEPSENMEDPAELVLQDLVNVLPIAQPTKLTVEGHFWTDFDLNLFLMFEDISTKCFYLKLQDVLLFIRMFRYKRDFKMCTIVTVEVDPAIRVTYDAKYRAVLHDETGLAYRWEVPGASFSVGIVENTFTFEKTA